jgi:phage gpG-like protein
MNIKIEVQGKEELLTQLTNVVGKIKDKTELFNRFSPYINQYIRQTIDARGRPGGSFAPLSPLTIALRRKGKKKKVDIRGTAFKDAKPLKDRGIYYASFHELGRGKDYVDNGTADKRGPKLHYGGMTEAKTLTLKVPAYTAQAMHSRYKMGSWKVRAHTKVMHLGAKAIPARPHVFLGDDGVLGLVKIAEEYISEQAIQNN